jgi:5-methylcytosine-specific restriction endonuclease McrA
VSTKRPLSITPKNRYLVLNRDGHRCVSCGAGPAATPLHVDHIYPLSLGGRDDPLNLVTLCEACNLGKGAGVDWDATLTWLAYTHRKARSAAASQDQAEDTVRSAVMYLRKMTRSPLKTSAA